MPLDDDARYRALSARDPRFDGLFFVGVTTTGVYCRPVCPARTPARSRCRFFTRSAQAEGAGFRACFRCRPELAPGASSVDAISRLVDRAVRRIEGGALNHDGSLPALAEELGVTARHLRRAMKREIGVTPVELAQSCRLALAKQLLQDSKIGLARVAFASGFSSVRRFNAAFRARFGKPPSEVRRARKSDEGTVPLTLGYREPYDYDALLGFLDARLSPRVAEIVHGRYRQTLRIGAEEGYVEVTRGDRRTLRVAVSTSLMSVLPIVAARMSALFDLDARPLAIEQTLKADADLGAVIERQPGLRVPGTLDPFELIVRTIVGQQVSVKAATTFATRFAERFGDPIETPWPNVDRLAPSAAAIARRRAKTLTKIGVTSARAETIIAVARAMQGGELRLDGSVDAELARCTLRNIRGIGPWTTEYVAMRALRDPDAFPTRDLGLMRALGIDGAELDQRAETWRPFRAYAAMTIWRM